MYLCIYIYIYTYTSILGLCLGPRRRTLRPISPPRLSAQRFSRGSELVTQGKGVYEFVGLVPSKYPHIKYTKEMCNVHVQETKRICKFKEFPGARFLGGSPYISLGNFRTKIMKDTHADIDVYVCINIYIYILYVYIYIYTEREMLTCIYIYIYIYIYRERERDTERDNIYIYMCWFV